MTGWEVEYAADCDPASEGLLGSSLIGGVVDRGTDEVTHTRGTSDTVTAFGAADRVVREPSGPPRLTGGPAASRKLAPLTRGDAVATRTVDPGIAYHAPAAVASSTVAYHRLRPATDVGARRHDAETPTVSPD